MPLPWEWHPDWRLIPAARSQNGRLSVSLPVLEAPTVAWSMRAKRAMDISVSACALVALSPVIFLIAAAIRLTSRGPALYRQWREGLDGLPFEVLKFRTLHSAAETGDFSQVLPGDPQITGIGRFLRRSRLDELPQLWNVLRGEMSLVGPRPHAVLHGARCAALLPAYRLRHRAKPGMTGLAQVSGLIGPIVTRDDLQRRLDKDLIYIRDWSLGLDLWILLRTPALWFRRIRRDTDT
jgi:lipopolysaccharide/colanic/teichoic acid biosynthesis glycosyltransferase